MAKSFCQCAMFLTWFIVLSVSCQMPEEGSFLPQMGFGMRCPQRQLLSVAEVYLLSLLLNKLLR
jgi:hypothetical protein